MGYRIRIGQREDIVLDKEKGKEPYVAKVDHDGAPDDGNDGHLNERQPSYIAMEDFASKTGLKELFGELIMKHPGYVPLTKKHLTHLRIPIQSRLKMIKANNPMNAERLLWFEFWIDWALKNCKNPVIWNS